MCGNQAGKPGLLLQNGAAVLSGVLRNGSMEDCVRLGTAASAHVIQCVGANTGIRDLKTLLAFIGTHPLEIRYTGK